MRKARLLGIVLLSLGAAATLWAADIVATASFNSLRVYPNPWRADRHARILVTFDGLPAGATIRLYALNGHSVKTLTADDSGRVFWDRTNQDGDVVASGLYLYTASFADSKPIVGKIALLH